MGRLWFVGRPSSPPHQTEVSHVRAEIAVVVIPVT